MQQYTFETIECYTSHCNLKMNIKGVVHFKKTFADNLLTPMSSKMSMSFFLHLKKIKVFDENISGFFSI